MFENPDPISCRKIKIFCFCNTGWTRIQSVSSGSSSMLAVRIESPKMFISHKDPWTAVSAIGKKYILKVTQLRKRSKENVM